jgi:hypothetical protein
MTGRQPSKGIKEGQGQICPFSRAGQLEEKEKEKEKKRKREKGRETLEMEQFG